MRLLSWLQEQIEGGRPALSVRRRRAKFRPRSRLAFEILEDRTVLSSLTVLNTYDSGVGSLRAAIAAAHNGDTIVFDQSLSGQTLALTSGELLLKQSVTITGPSDRSVTISGNNLSRVFEVGKGNKQVTLNGLTITGGLAADGGGILNQGTLTISNCILSGNSTLSGNIASYGGGAIHNYGTLTISGSTLSNNFAASGGGGIANERTGMLTIDNNSILSFNTANNSGGGINSDGTLTISGSYLSNNSAPYGGGIIATGTMTISGSTLSNNSAGNGYGGGIYTGTNYYTGGTFTVSGCTLSGNSAGGGGGIYDGAGTLKVIGSTLSGNSARFGGGIYNYHGILTLSGSMLSDNIASVKGGGIYITGGVSPYGAVTVISCTLSGNSATAGGAIYNNGSALFLSVSNSSFSTDIPDYIVGLWTDGLGNTFS